MSYCVILSKSNNDNKLFKINLNSLYIMAKNVPKDTELWAKVQEMAKTTFREHPTAYSNAWAVRRYAKLGGDWQTEGGDLGNWFREGWLDVIPLLKEGKVVLCGKGEGSACRPTKRINKDTPITIQELLYLHSVSDLLKFAERKANNMELKAFWKELEFK